MILKKPYAFLIKYYRIIHLALAFLLGVGAYKLMDIIRFFNSYVKNNYTTTVITDLEKIYTPFSLFVIVFLIIAFASAILVLLRHKNKPINLYLAVIIYYTFILLGLFYISSVLQSFETELLSSTLSRSLRDIFIIFYLPQFILIILVLLKTVGFNIKKFDFTDDRKEFISDVVDNEEFEINVKFDGHRIKQKTNRILREGIYYIKENKFIVLCVSVVIAIILGFFIYNNIHSNRDSNYSMRRTFIYNNLNVTVEDAIISNLDYNGNVISDKYYLVLKMHITNNSGYTVNVDYNNFKLSIGNDLINPTVNMAGYFIDFASNIVPTSISHKGDKTFALVYEIKSNQTKRDMELKIHTGSYYEKDEYVHSRIFVKIKPSIVRDLSIVGNYSLKDILHFNDTFLSETSVVINDYTIEKTYIYKYDVCSAENTCVKKADVITVPITGNRHNNKLIILQVDYKQDMETAYSDTYTTLHSFAENFVEIQYKVGEQVYSDKSINVTPLNSTNLIAFEVPKDIDEATIIQAIITIRNEKYIINLKLES